MKKYALPFLLLLILFTVFGLFGGLTHKIHLLSGEESLQTTATPAAWTSISVSQEAGNGLLQWKTSTVAGIDCFVIERSADGKTFESLGHIRTSGADHQDYIFRDPALVYQPGKRVFYRLKQIDQKGRALTSEVRKLQIPKAQQVRLEARKKMETADLTIRYFTGISPFAQMNVVDESGKIVLHETLQPTKIEQELNIKLDEWAQGTYVIQLFNATSRTQYRFTIG